MILNLTFALLMAGMFLYMLCRSKMRETREFLWLPLGTCAVELLSMGLLSAVKFPVLTLLLVALRLSMFGFCVLLMKRDAALARAEKKKRARQKRELYNALHPLHEVPAGGAAPSREVCIA